MKTMKIMKNRIKLFGFIATVAIITFTALSLTGCDDGSTGGGGPSYTSYDGEGNSYSLRITKSVKGPDRAATVYVPQDGDAYTLTIKSYNGQTIGTSTGWVVDVTDGTGATYTITIKHDETNNTVAVTVSGNGITAFSDTIYLDGGGTRDKPDGLIQTKPKPTPGASVKVWPNASILQEYGISGLSDLSGTKSDFWAIDESVYGRPRLTITFTGSSANDSTVNSCFVNNGWTLDSSFEGSYFYSKAGFESSAYMRTSNTGRSIQIEKSSGGSIWPTSGYLSDYGLSGFTAPSGATDIAWSEQVSSDGGPMLLITFKLSSQNDSAITSCFSSNGWTSGPSTNTQGVAAGYNYSKTGFYSGTFSWVKIDDHYRYTVGTVKR